MPTPWLDLLVIGVVVFLSRLIAPRLPVAVPDTVLQLIGGLLLGPAGLGWLRVDDLVIVGASLGMGYLLLTAGMELEFHGRRPSRRASALAAAAGTSLLALVLAGLVASAVHIHDRAAIAAALITTLMIPGLRVIRANPGLGADLAHFTILAGTYGEIAAALVIAVAAAGADPVLSLIVAGLLLGATTLLGSVRGRRAIARPLARVPGSALSSGALPLGIVAACALLAPTLGGEVVLPTLAAGVWCSSRLPRRTTWAALRARLDGLGLAALAPISFVAAGARVHPAAMSLDDRTWLAVPVLIAAMWVCRAVPALVLARRSDGSRLGFASGLLLSTKMTLVVVAVEVGERTGALSGAGGSALVLAAMATVCVFPTVADRLARPGGVRQGCGPRHVEPAAARVLAPGAPAPETCSVKAEAAFSNA